VCVQGVCWPLGLLVHSSGHVCYGRGDVNVAPTECTCVCVCCMASAMYWCLCQSTHKKQRNPFWGGFADTLLANLDVPLGAGACTLELRRVIWFGEYRSAVNVFACTPPLQGVYPQIHRHLTASDCG
jgi:hypothetical protein